MNITEIIKHKLYVRAYKQLHALRDISTDPFELAKAYLAFIGKLDHNRVNYRTAIKYHIESRFLTIGQYEDACTDICNGIDLKIEAMERYSIYQYPTIRVRLDRWLIDRDGNVVYTDEAINTVMSTTSNLVLALTDGYTTRPHMLSYYKYETHPYIADATAIMDVLIALQLGVDSRRGYAAINR